MRILLIEDEKHLSEALVHLLKHNNYLVDAVYDGMDGYNYIKSEIYDIVILDIMLPSLSGLEILRRIRMEKISIPVLMLTAKTQIHDKVLGLDYGADDYLSKPFATEELLARLRALSRRKNNTIEPDELIIGDIQYNNRTLSIIGNNKVVSLSHLENELFYLLVVNKNYIVSKESIIVKLWGYDSNAEDNNVEVYISFLRKKLKYVSEKVTINTTRNVGYKLEVI
ncbi:MAG: response regulator transcription factor [Firmicutes bacterium]|nr:response regulator transcription factor [Bacillota bacterium]